MLVDCGRGESSDARCQSWGKWRSVGRAERELNWTSFCSVAIDEVLDAPDCQISVHSKMRKTISR